MIKTDIPGLYRDERSGAVINKDNAALASYKAKKRQVEEMKMLKNRVDNIEGKIDQILLLLSMRGNS